MPQNCGLESPTKRSVVTLAGGAGAPALMPFAVGVLAAFVAYGRWRLVPLRESSGERPTR
jgi:hypothetical protein